MVVFQCKVQLEKALDKAGVESLREARQWRGGGEDAVVNAAPPPRPSSPCTAAMAPGRSPRVLAGQESQRMVPFACRDELNG